MKNNGRIVLPFGSRESLLKTNTHIFTRTNFEDTTIQDVLDKSVTHKVTLADEMQYDFGEWAAMQIQTLTPYTETKTGYIGDTEVTFYDTPQGNLTVYFPHEYTVERMADRIIVSFKELEEVTNVTISII